MKRRERLRRLRRLIRNVVKCPVCGAAKGVRCTDLRRPVGRNRNRNIDKARRAEVLHKERHEAFKLTDGVSRLAGLAIGEDDD